MLKRHSIVERWLRIAEYCSSWPLAHRGWVLIRKKTNRTFFQASIRLIKKGLQDNQGVRELETSLYVFCHKNLCSFMAFQKYFSKTITLFSMFHFHIYTFLPMRKSLFHKTSVLINTCISQGLQALYEEML